MKSEEKLKNEIKKLVDESALESTPKKRIKVIKERVSFLRQCVRYIQTNPTVDCLKRQLDGIVFKLKTISERYETWALTHGTGDGVEDRKKYATLNEISKLKKQLSTLRFLMR